MVHVLYVYKTICKSTPKRCKWFHGELKDDRVFSHSDSGAVFTLFTRVYVIRSNIYLPRLSPSVQTLFLFLFHGPHLIACVMSTDFRVRGGKSSWKKEIKPERACACSSAPARIIFVHSWSSAVGSLITRYNSIEKWVRTFLRARGAGGDDLFPFLQSNGLRLMCPYSHFISYSGACSRFV